MIIRDERSAARARLGIYLLFLLLCLLGGGGSRGDILSLLYLRPGAVLCLAAILLVPGRVELARIKVPLLLLIALAIWILIQLIPLPPGLWTRLPGREMVVAGGDIVGLAPPWRPISQAPDLTLNSLASLVVPFTALIGFAALDEDQRRSLLPVLLGAAFAGALLGIAQLAGGPGSPFYLYRVTNDGAAVGLFANRNHHAAMLVLTFAMVSLWAAQARGDRSTIAARASIAASFAIFLIPMILVTGSRAGLVFGAAAAAWAIVQFSKDRRVQRGERGFGWKVPLAAVGTIAAVGGLFSLVAFSRAQAVQRLLSQADFELRLQVLPTLLQMARDKFPFGSGFGSFDPIYRIYEPYRFLSPRYLNQAHNDLVELAITGGLPALLLLVVFLVWWAAVSISAFRGWNRVSRRLAFARLGSILILILLAWSLVDYPLRVPFMAALFAIACGWLGGAGRAAAAQGEPEASLRFAPTGPIAGRPLSPTRAD